MPDIVRRDPFGLTSREFVSPHRAMDRIFDRVFAGSSFRLPSGGSNDGTLAVDISEQDGDIIVRAAVPGFSKDDIDARLHDGVLSITAQRDQESEQKGQRYYRRELRRGAASRRIVLPGAVHDADVGAELSDGVLTLTITTPERAKPQQIEIKAA